MSFRDEQDVSLDGITSYLIYLYQPPRNNEQYIVLRAQVFYNHAVENGLTEQKPHSGTSIREKIRLPSKPNPSKLLKP